MTIDSVDVILICDRAGIIAFAFAGAQVAIRRRLDLFGVIVLGVVTATGGGLMRDVILDRMPLVLVREDYLVLAVGASLLSIVVAASRVPLLGFARQLSESVGLGAFAVAGAFAAMDAGLSLPAVLVIAIVTATGGGVIRDLLAARVPMLLRSEINATAVACGALVAWLLESQSTGIAGLAGLGTTAGLRMAGTALNLHLPIPGAGMADAAGD